jgi:hypothetical protein
VEFSIGDRDFGSVVGLTSRITMPSAPSTRTGFAQIEDRERGLDLISKDNPDLKGSFHYDIEYLMLFVEGHVRRVPAVQSGWS